MKRSDYLKQKRAEKVAAQKTMLDERKAAGKDKFDEDDKTRFNQLNDEIELLDDEIADAEKEERALERAAQQNPTPADNGIGDGEDKEKRKMRKRLSITKALRSHDQDGVEKEIFDMALEEARNAGVSVEENTRFMMPASMVYPDQWSRADQHTVGEDAGEYGGQLVVDNAPRLQDGFMPKLWLEEAGATVWSGLSGGKVPIPVSGNYDFAWLSEVANNTIQKQKFDGPALDPKRASAAVSYSNKLLMQSSVRVDQTLMAKLGQGAARAIQGAAINGAGGTAPTGVLNTTGILTAADVAAAAPTWKRMLELKGLIEDADATANSVAYLMRPILGSDLEGRTKDAGSGRFLLENDKIAGKKAIQTSLVPSGAGSLESLIYGDWSQLFIGLWGGVAFIVDPYTQAGANSTVIHVNLHADVQIAQPKAFAVNNFLDPTA